MKSPRLLSQPEDFDAAPMLMLVQHAWSSCHQRRTDWFAMRQAMGQAGVPAGPTREDVETWWQGLVAAHPWPLPLSFALRLKALATSSRRANPIVQLPDDITEEEIWRLNQEGTNDEKIALALHLNTPLDILAGLSWDGFAEEVDQNPMFLLYLEQGSSEALIILENVAKQTPRSERLRELSTSPFHNVRMEVASNVHTPTEVLFLLSKDENNFVRCRVAFNKNTPREAVLNLINDGDDDIRWRIASHPHAPVDALELLSKDPIWRVRQSVAGHVNTPSAVLDKLANDEYGAVQMNVAKNKSTAISTLVRLTRDPDLFLQAVAQQQLSSRGYRQKNPVLLLDDDLSEEELGRIAKVGSNEEKQAVALHPNTSLKTLLFLSRQGFAEDVEQNPMFLFHLEAHRKDAIEVLVAVAGQTKNPNRMLEFTHSPHEEIRAGLSRNESITPDILDIMAEDSSDDVRFYVCRAPGMKPSTFYKLYQDSSVSVRVGIASNPETPEELIDVLAKDDNSNVRWSVVDRENVSLGILELLSRDADYGVRSGVANRRDISLELLEMLAEDEHVMVRNAALQNLQSRNEG